MLSSPFSCSKAAPLWIGEAVKIPDPSYPLPLSRWRPYFLCFVVVQSLSCVWLWSHELQHTRLPCPSPSSGACSNSCPLSWWCHPTISSSVVPFSSCPQSCPASGSFQMSQLFALGGQSIAVSVSTLVLPMNTQDWSPLEWTGWISWQFKGLSWVYILYQPFLSTLKQNFYIKYWWAK